MEIDGVIARAEAALLRAAVDEDPRSPMAAVLHRVARRMGEPADSGALLRFWAARASGSRVGDARYRWEVHHERAPSAGYCPSPERWTAWRAREAPVLARDRSAFAAQLTLPIALSQGLELLLELSTDPDVGPMARELLEEAEPVMRTDLASYVRGTHTFSDAFALSCLSRAPRALERMRPFAIAIAACYSPAARKADGVVHGMRFPFHDWSLASASAMLAGGLWALGSDIALVGRIVERLAVSGSMDGGYADDDEPDVLTTFVVAELLSRIEPTFELGPSVRFLSACQLDDGFFRVLGPETPWLTEAIVGWLRTARLPFAARFVWPRFPDANLDSKTRLPPYAHFVELTELFAAIRGLSASSCSVCFMDLAGFREFNNTYGQDLGDRALAAFAEELASLPESVAIRDGGDEFLLVGAPTGGGLGAAIEALRDRWPARFVERFGTDAPPVVARFLTADVTGAQLRRTREVLGRAVGDLKHLDASADPRGLRRDLGRLT